MKRYFWLHIPKNGREIFLAKIESTEAELKTWLAKEFPNKRMRIETNGHVSIY